MRGKNNQSCSVPLLVPYARCVCDQSQPVLSRTKCSCSTVLPVNQKPRHNKSDQSSVVNESINQSISPVPLRARVRMCVRSLPMTMTIAQTPNCACKNIQSGVVVRQVATRKAVVESKPSANTQYRALPQHGTPSSLDSGGPCALTSQLPISAGCLDDLSNISSPTMCISFATTRFITDEKHRASRPSTLSPDTPCTAPPSHHQVPLSGRSAHRQSPHDTLHTGSIRRAIHLPAPECIAR